MNNTNYSTGTGPILLHHNCEKKPQLKKMHFSLFISMLFLLCICSPFSTVWATDYYVSSSIGNNGNIGTSSASPWQTLSQISERTFVAGDQIFLKCGDTWNETVTLNGNGSSATPITLTWYGTGERPYIHGPADNVSACVSISATSQGWQIFNIEIGYAKNGILILQNSTIRSTYDYYKVQNCYIHDCINLNWTGVEPNRYTGYAIFVEASGYTTSANTIIQNCIFARNDGVNYHRNSHWTNFLLDGCTITKGYLNQVFQSEGDNFDIKSCMFDHNTNPGRCDTKYGVTAIISANMSGAAGVNEVSGNEFGWQGEMGSSHDGCGFDFEASGSGMSFINNYIHDSYGEGVLMMSGFTFNNLLVDNNIFAYNLNGSNQHSAEFDIRSMSVSGSGTISNNKFYLRAGKTNFNYMPTCFTYTNNTNPATPFAAQPTVAVTNGSGTDKICTVTCSTAGATIRYTTDGSLPTATSPVVANGGTVTISGYTKAFNAKAFATGYNPSPTDSRIVVLGGTTPPTVIKAWEFTSNTEGWTAGNQMTGFGWVTGGYVNGTITGTDPYMYSGTNLGVNITDYKYLKIRMKNSTTGTLGKMYFITDADGVYNEAKRKAFTITANDPGYTEYTLDMTAVAGWTGTLKQLRFDPVEIGATSGSFSVDYIRIQLDNGTPPPPTIIKAWEFTSNTESWTAGNQITGFAWVTGGYVNGTITGTDPYMYSGTNLGVNITDYKYLKIRMKNSSSGNWGKFYFITNADGTYNEAKSKGFTLTANDPGYTEYTVDMTAVTGWAGTLKQLRFDPNIQIGSFSIDYIRIQSASGQLLSSSYILDDSQATNTSAPGVKSAFVGTTAIAETTGGPSFNIFPNPAKDKAIIFYNLPKPGDAFIRIFNAQGKMLKTFKLPTEGGKGSNQYTLDLSGLTPGIYIVKYSNGEYVKSVKLLID